MAKFGSKRLRIDEITIIWSLVINERVPNFSRHQRLLLELLMLLFQIQYVFINKITSAPHKQ